MNRTGQHDLPPVSVIMSVYNGAAYVEQAIESTLAQTHPHFEFIIVDDGSTDQTGSIIREYATRDRRIRVISQPNQGQVAGLNRALTEAAYEWVARLDHDDINLPHRLEHQLMAIRANPAVRVLGAYGFEIDQLGRKLGVSEVGPTSAAEFERLRRQHRLVMLIHSSVMMHRPTILALGGYQERFRAAEDRDLWSRVADDHLILALPEPLVCYRIHATSMYHTHFFEARCSVRWIEACQYARRHGRVEPTLDEHLAALRGQPIHTRLNWLRLDWSYYLSRQAWLRWLAGHRREAAALFVGASILDPGRLTRRLQERRRRQGYRRFIR
jgi:glycosyltransferase involved in cell wall biosynthesis